MMLSILVPIYNESNYIAQCIESILSSTRNDFEIVISDNCSTDESLDIIETFDDGRIKVIKQNTKLTPIANYWATVSAAQGKYIFAVGGDDYLEVAVLDRIIPMLNNNNVIIGNMACFDDKTKKLFSVANEAQYLKSIFNLEYDFTDCYFANLRDEVMYAFIKRSDILSTSGLVDNSLERLLIWQALIIFSGNRYNRVIFYDGVVLYKRYNKDILSGNYTKDAHNSFFQSLYIVKSLSSLYNSFYLFYVNKNIGELIKVVLKRRVFSSQGGFLGLNKDINLYYYGPFLMFCLSPFIDVARFFVAVKKKIERKI